MIYAGMMPSIIFGSKNKEGDFPSDVSVRHCNIDCSKTDTKRHDFALPFDTTMLKMMNLSLIHI